MGFAGIRVMQAWHPTFALHLLPASAAVADIVRMVEAAQSRTAPVQRFADVVAVSRQPAPSMQQHSLTLPTGLPLPGSHPGGSLCIVKHSLEHPHCCLTPPGCVQGKFTYGVMGIAATTFLFWSGIGTRLFPQVQ